MIPPKHAIDAARTLEVMPSIDQADFQFDATAGWLAAVMVGFLVFSVALDLRWADLARVVRAPRAPLVGLASQLVVLPAVAFVLGVALTDTPSVALGLLLVASCPGGALSNYLTGLAKGDVATSVTMTAISTATSVVATPLLFALWASMSPPTRALLREVEVDPARILVALAIMLALPVTLGMLVRARLHERAERVRRVVRRIAIAVFAVVVIAILGGNARVLVAHGAEALPAVGLAFTLAVALGWIAARAAGLSQGERRAVALEVGLQNVALAIGMALAFFPQHAGVAITAATWGAVHVIGGLLLATSWARLVPLRARDPALSS